MEFIDRWVAAGGPSAPVWILFVTVLSGIGACIKFILQVRSEAQAANQKVDKTIANTTNISNGFASGVNLKLDSIIEWQQGHMEYHLEKELANERAKQREAQRCEAERRGVE